MNRTERIKRGAAALLLVGVVGACSPPRELPTTLGSVAPDFTLETVDGRSLSLADTAGEVRLIDFWATWCAPCREEIPMLNELQQAYGDRGFRILAISDEDAAVVREFVAQHGVQYTNLVDTANVSGAYGVFGLPSAYLLDGEGRVVESYVGAKPRRPLQQKIESLLAGAGPT